MTGQLVGHYRVLEKIGAGAMGEVFRARDERLGRDVALKLIRPASSDNPDHLRRFEQEARASAALNHPNILAIYDVGFEGKVPYIVSELLEGENLRQRLFEGPIPLRAAADYALQIAQGLTAAHDRLIVHRDLKPENLFLTNDGRIKILDFGVAKLLSPPAEDGPAIESMTTVTKQGAIVGTFAYMSPEQLRSKPVDHRSDIFSFGAILYEMMSGCRAFHGETEVDTMTAVLREEPPSAQMEEAAIPPGYQDIVRHCLEKDPENRFQSAKDLVFALQTLSGSSGGNAAPSPKPVVRTVSAMPWALVALLAIATAFLAVAQLVRVRATPPSYSRLTFEAGTVYSARFAQKGQSVVYGAAWNNNPVQLFTTVGDSLLTQSLNVNDADLLAISPGNELAVALHGTRNAQFEIVDGMLARTPLAGGSPKELLADVRWADWDAKGGLAVVHDVDGQSRLEYPIGNVLYQNNGGWISNIRFSPHYDQIAFMNHRTLWDHLGVVCVVDLAGHVQTLTPEWGSEQGVAWRPDGKEIWFTAVEKGTNLNLMAVTLSGKVRTVLDLPMGITLQDIAPDGRVLVALNSKRMAMAFSALGGKQDAELSWHDWNVAKDISRDGQSVLFEDSSEATGKGHAVALRKLDGSLPVRLGDGSGGGLSPDGKWAIAFTGQPTQIMLLPTGPGQPRPVETSGLESINSGWARFLEDGQRIIANGNQQGHASRCYVLELAGGKATAVTPEGIKCGPSSPDNRFVVGVGANSAAAIYPIAGGPSLAIPSLESGFVPVQWSSDGTALFGYHSGELPSKIYKVAIATGKQTVVQELRPGAPAGVVSVSPVIVSRDGTRFAYSYNEALSVLYLISGLH
jgi:eukaryotic-like serine/threonine-protein kinase